MPQSKSSEGRTCKTSSDYQAAYPDPLKLRAGEPVTVADRKSEWPGWLWCTDRSGKAGWVPADYIHRVGSTGKMLVDYDATELTVEVGAKVEVLKEQSGWALCRTENGDLGWLPLKILGI